MQISCPKCSCVYEIDEKLVSGSGRKLRCSKCGEVFVAKLPMPSDSDDKVFEDAPIQTEENIESMVEDSLPNNESASVERENAFEAESGNPEQNVSQDVSQDIGQEINQNQDVNDMFKRLSEQTESLFKAENELSTIQRSMLFFKRVLGWSSKFVRWIVMSVSMICFALALYSFRYEIVRKVPFLGYVYSAVGIQARVVGEGLEFRNISWKKFEEDYIRKLRVNGFVVNLTNKDIEFPLIHVELLDKDAKVLQSVNQKPMLNVLRAGQQVPVEVIVAKPSPITKYVFMTFSEEE